MPLAKIAVLIVELTPSPLKGEAGWRGGEAERVPRGFECLREVLSEIQRMGDVDGDLMLHATFIFFSFSAARRYRTGLLMPFYPIRTHIHTYKKPIYSEQLGHLTHTYLGCEWEQKHLEGTHTDTGRSDPIQKIPATRQRR